MSGKILLIDDEERAFSLIKYIDIFFKGNYQTDWAKTVSEGINLIKHNDYKVIICDLMLPLGETDTGEELIGAPYDIMNGKIVLDYCYKKELYKSTKLILSSAAHTRAEELSRNYSGAVQLLAKPFDLFGLMELIK